MSTAVHVSLMGVDLVGLWVPTPSSRDMVQPICRVLALPQMDLLALTLSA